MIHTGIKTLFDEFDQAGGYQIVVIHGFGVIPHRGRIAHDHEDIAQAEGMGSQQVALDTQQVAPTCREMQGGFHANLMLDDIADRPGRHAHARHGTIGHIDHIRAGFLEQGSPGDEFMGGEAARRVHFGGNDKFPFAPVFGPAGRAVRPSETSEVSNCFRGMEHLHTAARRVGSQRLAHGGDMAPGWYHSSRQ